jgi:diacylglycerol kinase
MHKPGFAILNKSCFGSFCSSLSSLKFITMKRLILSILAGFLFTSIITTVVDHIFHITNVYPPYGESFKETGLLSMAFTYRALFAIAGGYITARIAKDKARKAVLILGIIGTIAWLAGLIKFWDLAPAWYNIGGLILAIPYAFIGLNIYYNLKYKRAILS